MMVTTVSLLLDLVLLGLLVYFFVMGVRRGLILSLCSLLAVLLALLGGWYLATHWSQPLEDRLEPVILESLLDKEENGQTDPSATQENLARRLFTIPARTGQSKRRGLENRHSQRGCQPYRRAAG